MQLKPEQIQRLYQFTRQHYVEYYDLQSELVDHLANGIEQQWQTYPNRSFEEALRIEFKKYGVFGFTDLVEQRQKAMGKTYYKLVLKLMKVYFTIPKIIQTIFFILIFYMGLMYLPYPNYVVYSCAIAIIVFVFYKNFKWRSVVNKRKQAKQKIWMYEEIIYSCGSSLGIFQLIIQMVIQFRPTNQFTNIGFMFASVFIVILGLMAYVLTIKIPNKAKEYIIKVHPEYGIV